MGTSQSTQSRRISIENDDPASVIKVSDSVVQRLKGAADNQSTQTSPQAQQTSRQSEPSESIVSGGIYPSKTSVEIRQEQEAALRYNDQYWQRRLKIMEDSHKMINAKLEEEYNKAVKEVEDLFARLPAAPDKQSCDAAEALVKKCYQQHPREVLKCAKEVEDFAACVDVKRINIVHSRQ